MIAEVASKFPFAKILKISKMKKNGDIKDVLIVALPMILSMSFDTLMTFVDRLFLSKLGPTAMNASLGGGGMSKLNLPGGRLERFHNPKFPEQYISMLDEVLRQKEALFDLMKGST